jgi:8-oxo-dGTP diphosphatase
MANTDACDGKIANNITYVATNAILHNSQNQILLIKKISEPFKNHFYLPGGYINYGERIEDALKRLIQKNVSLIIEPLEILGVYSCLNNPYNHVISVVFICLIVNSLDDKDKISNPEVEKCWVHFDDFYEYCFLFSHKDILEDYLKWRQNNGTYWSSKIR